MNKFYLKGIGGQLIIEENFAIIERKGALGFLSKGFSGSKRIPIKSITSVQLKDGGMMTNGYIQFGVLGGREKTGGLFNASQDENTVMFYYKNNDLANKIREYIETIILEKQNNNQTIVNEVSNADEILKYKKLYDEGILTETEFNLKKKELLNL